MPRPILIAVDFSRCSEHALQQGLRIARWNAAPVRVLHVVNVPLMDPMPPPILPLNLPTVDILIEDALRRWEQFSPGPPGTPDARF